MYRFTPFNFIERIADGATFPADPENLDYQECLRWLEAGNGILPVAPPSIEAQKIEINRQRDVDLLQGVTYNGNVFHSDDAFRADLTDLIMGYDKGIFPADSVQNIRTVENTIVQLNAQQLITLKLMIGQMRQTVFAASWAAKDALDNPQ